MPCNQAWLSCQTSHFVNATKLSFEVSFVFVHCFSLCGWPLALSLLSILLFLHWMACCAVMPLVIFSLLWTGLGVLAPTVWLQIIMSPHLNWKGTMLCIHQPSCRYAVVPLRLWYCSLALFFPTFQKYLASPSERPKALTVDHFFFFTCVQINTVFILMIWTVTFHWSITGKLRVLLVTGERQLLFLFFFVHLNL